MLPNELPMVLVYLSWMYLPGKDDDKFLVFAKWLCSRIMSSEGKLHPDL